MNTTTFETLDKTLAFESYIFERDMNSLVDMYTEQYITEGVLDGLKSILDKIVRVAFTYIKTLKEYVFLSYKKRDFDRLYNKIGEMLKKYPNFGTYKITIPDTLKDYELGNAISSLKRIELLKNDYRLYTMVSNLDQYLYKSIRTPNGTTTVNNLYKYSKNEIDAFDKKMEDMKSTLLSVKKLLEVSEYRDITVVDIMKSFCYAIKEMVQFIYRRLVINVESVYYSLSHSVTEKVYEVGNAYIEESFPDDYEKRIEDIQKSYGTLKYKYSTSLNKMKFRIYESETNEQKCAMLISPGVIIVEKGFFKQPTGIQEAVILHEMGHEYVFTRDGHRGDEDLIRQIKRKEKYFQSFVNKYPQFKEYKDIYDTELFYLIDESLADEFSKKRVGKRIYDKTILNRFKDDLDSTMNISDSDKKINMDNMRTRLKM